MYFCHAPRERVSWNENVVDMGKQILESRSTWACELKLFISSIHFLLYCHAPRERVSWNPCVCNYSLILQVTLHVSVWVEISSLTPAVWVFQRSRSTWACELKCKINTCNIFHYVTLHVSVWVEIVNKPQPYLQILSRSTWACELKCVWWFSDFWGR